MNDSVSLEKAVQAGKRTYATKAVLTFLLERDGSLCTLCSKPFSCEDLEDMSIDHIKPQAKGGLHTLDNFQLAHSRCNTSKGKGSRAHRLISAGILPKGMTTKDPEYARLYKEARGDIEMRWWKKWRSLVGFGSCRFSLREWDRIQDDVYAKVWKMLTTKGAKAALAYNPTREEFQRRGIE